MMQRAPDDQNLPHFEDLFKKIPFFTLLLLCVLIALCLLDIGSQVLSTAMINDPAKVMPSGYQVWRLFSSLFYEDSLFLTALIVVNYYQFLSKLENKTSTIWLISTYILCGFVIQLIFTGLWWAFNAGQHTNWFAYGGASSIWFNLMFKYCYFNRDNKIKLCCSSIKINKIFYPLIMFFMVTVLFSFKIHMDIVVAIILAFLQCRFLKDGNLINYGCCCLAKFNRCCMCLRLGTFQAWVNYDEEKINKNYSVFAGIQHMQSQASTKFSQTDNIFQNQKGHSLAD